MLTANGIISFLIIIIVFTNPYLPYIHSGYYFRLKNYLFRTEYIPCDPKAPYFTILNFQFTPIARDINTSLIITIISFNPPLPFIYLRYHSRLKDVLHWLKYLPCVLRIP